MKEYGRKVFITSLKSFEESPLGEVSKTPVIIDPFSGLIKANKPLGGEVIVYFPGFLTDIGYPYDVVFPTQDTFVDVRGEKGLSVKKWGLLDSFFFTYEESGLDQYHTVNTAINPEENMRHAINFLKRLKEEFPLVQFNLVGHSLGALMALAAVKENLDAVNNLVLLNGPIRGIKRTIDKDLLVRLLRQFLRAKTSGLEEKVTDYLFALRENKTYQKELDEFIDYFTAKGREVFSFGPEDDPIVPVESTILPGVTKVIDGRPIRNSWSMGISLNPLEAHGFCLRNREVIGNIMGALGENLAVVG